VCVHVFTVFVGEQLPSQVLLSQESLLDRYRCGGATTSTGNCQCIWEENNWQGLLRWVNWSFSLLQS